MSETVDVVDALYAWLASSTGVDILADTSGPTLKQWVPLEALSRWRARMPLVCCHCMAVTDDIRTMTGKGGIRDITVTAAVDVFWSVTSTDWTDDQADAWRLADLVRQKLGWDPDWGTTPASSTPIVRAGLSIETDLVDDLYDLYGADAQGVIAIRMTTPVTIMPLRSQGA